MASYGKKVSNIISYTSVGVAMSLSKEVGILHVLLESQQPLTSVEIADRKQLKERYVRELLCCLATAEVVHVSTTEGGCLVYHLEEEEKQEFKTALMPHIAFPAVLTHAYDPVKACLPNSGPNGNRYSEAAHEFFDVFATYNIDLYVEKILHYADGLKEKLETGIEVIEFGCGRGSMLIRLAQLFPKSTFVASDIDPHLLDQMKANFGHIPNIKYEINDLCSLPSPPTKQYDWIYCTRVIQVIPNPLKALQGIRKLVTEPSGNFTMINKVTSGSPIDDKGNLYVAWLYACSAFLATPQSFQRDDSLALGLCWDKNTVISLATDAGFYVQQIELVNNEALFICKPRDH